MGCAPSSRVAPEGARVAALDGWSRLKQAKDQNVLAFKRVDEHVRKAPQSAGQSVQSLASYLVSGVSNDLEMARAVYMWITANIDYDMLGFRGELPKQPTDPNSVLINRICVCDGYSNLFLSLCEFAEIETMKLWGYCKNYKYDPTTPVEATSALKHSWNAVKLGGDWGLVDCTWGCGSFDSNRTFAKRQTDFYFLTDPEFFVENHYPCMLREIDKNIDKSWQLLKEPINMKTFQSRATRLRHCYEHQVELVSHRQALIDVDGKVTLNFRGTGRPLTGFHVEFENVSTGERLGSWTGLAAVLNHRTNEVEVTARPPTSTQLWRLYINATTDANAESKDLLVCYYLRLRRHRSSHDFPDFKGFYGLHGDPVRHGFTPQFLSDMSGFQLQARSGELQLRLPVKDPSVYVLVGFQSAVGQKMSEYCLPELTSSYLVLSLRMVEPGFHKLDLSTSCSKDNETVFLANFLIECLQPMKRPVPFPVYYLAAQTEHVQLEQPRDGELPADTDIQIKLSSPTIKKLQVRNIFYEAVSEGHFDFSVRTGPSGSDFCVFGSVSRMPNSFKCLYKFVVA